MGVFTLLKLLSGFGGFPIKSSVCEIYGALLTEYGRSEIYYTNTDSR